MKELFQVPFPNEKYCTVPKRTDNWVEGKSESHFYFPCIQFYKRKSKDLHLSTTIINKYSKDHSERLPSLKIKDLKASFHSELEEEPNKQNREKYQNNFQKCSPVTEDKQFQKCYASPISPLCWYHSVRCHGNVRSRATRDPFLYCCFLSCLYPLPNQSQSRKN